MNPILLGGALCALALGLAPAQADAPMLSGFAEARTSSQWWLADFGGPKALWSACDGCVPLGVPMPHARRAP